MPITPQAFAQCIKVKPRRSAQQTVRYRLGTTDGTTISLRE
ncbi:hypothetical protein [Acaryochloris thomasi]|nr:hypothetical protein [Acaryochloris thomasi]